MLLFKGKQEGKSPTEEGMWQGQCLPGLLAAAVPRMLPRAVRQHDGRANCNGWSKGVTGKNQNQPFGILVFVYPPLWYFSLAVNFIYQDGDGEKWLLFVRNARKAIRDPLNILALPYPSYQLHTSCAFCKDLLERQWLNEPVCDSGRGSINIQQEAAREKQGQKRRVSAGDDRRKRDKASRIYT